MEDFFESQKYQDDLKSYCFMDIWQSVCNWLQVENQIANANDGSLPAFDYAVIVENKQ